MVVGRMSTAASLLEAFGIGGFVGATAIGGSGAVEIVAARGSEPVGSVCGDERCSGATGAGVNGGGAGAAGGGAAADASGAEFRNSLDLSLAPASEAPGTGVTGGAGSVGTAGDGPGASPLRGDAGAGAAAAGN